MKKKLEIVCQHNGIIKEIIKKNTSKKFYRYLKRHNYIIFVNNIMKNNYDLVNCNDIIIIEYEENYISENSQFELNLDIVYEDEYLIVINKPKNLQTIPSKGDNINSLYNAILNYYKNNNLNSTIHFINRLDKKTRGLVLVAKDKLTALKLSKDLSNITRLYKAVVYNQFSDKEGIIKTFIYKDEFSIKRLVSDSQGSIAITKYKLLEEYDNNMALVRIRLYTGKTHQIRVHMSYINHPLVGDDLYSNDVGDLMLCSYAISFLHPYSKSVMEFEIEAFNEGDEIIGKRK